MPPKRVSFGFDLRVDPERQGWDDERQRNQRLVPTLASPLSADSNVWLQGPEVERLFEGNLPAYANPLNLARSIELLLDECRKREISSTGLVPLCITSVESNLIALESRFGPGYFDNPPEEQELLSSGWRLAGFDVVDLMGLISGLKGCGYKEPTWSQLRGVFGGSLNELGLFAEWQTASQFAEVQGLEIGEHAPFIVVGLLTKAPLQTAEP